MTENLLRRISLKNQHSQDMPLYLKSKFWQKNQIQPSSSLQKPSYQNSKHINFVYGNSFETPSHFKGSHGIISKESYKNPYLFINAKQDSDYAKNVELKLKQQSSIHNMNQFNLMKFNDGNQNKQNLTDKEVVLFNVATNQEKIVKMPTISKTIENNTFSEEFQKKVTENNSFKLKPGLFKDFIEKNKVMEIYGPLVATDNREGKNHFHQKVQNRFGKYETPNSKNKSRTQSTEIPLHRKKNSFQYSDSTYLNNKFSFGKTDLQAYNSQLKTNISCNDQFEYIITNYS